jgi:predicted RNA polymerase sigma factor
VELRPPAAARTDVDGNIVLLEDQDRLRWDQRGSREASPA